MPVRPGDRRMGSRLGARRCTRRALLNDMALLIWLHCVMWLYRVARRSPIFRTRSRHKHLGSAREFKGIPERQERGGLVEHPKTSGRGVADQFVNVDRFMHVSDLVPS